MTTFLDALKATQSRNAHTENGALTHSDSGNDVLNFFGLAGAMRNNVADAKRLFRAALAEDRQLAIRALFYLRDIRGGQGERDLFRTLFQDLTQIDPVAAKQTLKFVAEYGRWDDLFHIGLPVRDLVPVIGPQLKADNKAKAEGKSISLLGKWLPSENASSKTSRALAREMAEAMGLSNKQYRQYVVGLRKHIGLLEQKMSENDWSGIDYEHIPSQGSRKHVKAFVRHDQYRFESFLSDVMSGEKTMNAGTVFTYEVLDLIRKNQDSAANAVWKSLPDYTNGSNALVVADVSGSMGHIRSGGPIDVSTSLALYFAERNTGPFNGYFVTFSERPQLVKVRGNTLTEKLTNIGTADWSMNTNIQAVFDLVLSAAQRAGANAEDIPKVIYIVSDMEFDDATSGYGSRTRVTNYEAAKQKFAAAGFELPHLVFWNVNARNTNVPVTTADANVTLVSGLSQSTFKHVFEGKTPVESMLDVLNGERYEQIVVV